MKQRKNELKAEEGLSEILHGIEGSRGAELLLNSIVQEMDEYPTGEELSSYHFEQLRLKLSVILNTLQSNNSLLDGGHEQLREVCENLQEEDQ